MREREIYRKIRKNKSQGAMDEGTELRARAKKRERESEIEGKRKSAIKRVGKT